ncbi:hypothetical protein KAW18_15900, partial [candidate division WOR-3 bacterium]|nr:hypothetical protein [candidate division WOR-3 bacterium]
SKLGFRDLDLGFREWELQPNHSTKVKWEWAPAHDFRTQIEPGRALPHIAVFKTAPTTQKIKE